MATGVKPRDEDVQFSRNDLEAIQDAMKSKKFRDLLSDYCEEVRDPANQALYQKEMTQLEKERGYDITFINPKGGYVIKTSVAGDRKAFINICSNENIGKPSCKVQEVDGQRGMNWLLPYSLIPPREDFDNKKERCVIYDVVFHPDTLRMAEVNKRFRELVNKTATDGLQKTYNIHLDNNNFRFPKSYYKGATAPAVIRTEDPDYKPPTDEEKNEECSPELLDKFYPQHIYSPKTSDTEKKPEPLKRNARNVNKEFTHISDNGYTIPKYTIKQQKNVDFQDFTYHPDCKQHSAIPSQIVVEINLPLLSSTKDCILDVKQKSLSLVSEQPAKYKLSITLPYMVNDECGTAKFDKSKRKLVVTLPVIKKDLSSSNILRVDSGVESEENSGSQSDEDAKDNLIVEISSTSNENASNPAVESKVTAKDTFLKPDLAFILPPYTHNVLDDILAFTFHVRNTEPDSVKVKKDGNIVSIKFTSIGSGFVPIYYAAVIKFDDDINFENITGEAWDNNVILQLELNGVAPAKFYIGLGESMTCEQFNALEMKKSSKDDNCIKKDDPLVEVTNLGSETNIVVSSNNNNGIEDEDDEAYEESTIPEEPIVWIDNGSCETAAKSILRKKVAMRSFSESSVGDVASSIDYMSSDFIPEESSLKKTVRFSKNITRQFYRYNSSIEGQKKKNQRKKNKKRSTDRRKSESEAEDEMSNPTKTLKPRADIKQRRDSGLADTSDAEADFKHTDLNSPSSAENEVFSIGNSLEENVEVNANVPKKESSVLNIVNNNGNADPKPVIWESKTSKINKKPVESKPVKCDNIKHNTDLYNPDNLNKGQYLEVNFKNDLIFDLDM